MIRLRVLPALLSPTWLGLLRWLIGVLLLYLLPRAFAFAVGPEQHHVRRGWRLICLALVLGLVELLLLR